MSEQSADAKDGAVEPPAQHADGSHTCASEMATEGAPVATTESAEAGPDSAAAGQAVHVRQVNRAWFAVFVALAACSAFLLAVCVCVELFCATVVWSQFEFVRMFLDIGTHGLMDALKNIRNYKLMLAKDYIEIGCLYFTLRDAAEEDKKFIDFVIGTAYLGEHFLVLALLLSFVFCACVRCLTVDGESSYARTLRRYAIAYCATAAFAIVQACAFRCSPRKPIAVLLLVGACFLPALTAMRDLTGVWARRLLPVYYECGTSDAPVSA